MSFKRFDPDDFLISAESITAGAWTGNSPTLTQFLLPQYKPQPLVEIII